MSQKRHLFVFLFVHFKNNHYLCARKQQDPLCYRNYSGLTRQNTRCAPRSSCSGMCRRVCESANYVEKFAGSVEKLAKMRVGVKKVMQVLAYVEKKL